MHSKMVLTSEPWPVQLARYSFKKREKLAILRYFLQDLPPAARCLELGCAKGALSYFLRQMGGWWVSADLDTVHVQETRRVVGTSVVQVDTRGLPFRPGCFDVVVSMDYMEHIEDDRACLDELCSLVKPGGRLIIGTPCTGRLYLLNRVKPRLGLRLEHYGHVREGYRPEDLYRALLYRGFEVERVVTYARFLTEGIEMLMNWYYVWRQRRRASAIRPASRDGVIAPASETDFRSLEGAFRWYRRVYPLLWALTRLDSLAVPLRGYAMIISARKLGTPMWVRFHEARKSADLGHQPANP
ncbi:MAG: class I SAM-dependent methyltransferase [Acidobacteria bacterium]|nr:class I SAM-dependent methyltransferase [Acidobacteriota bacterium]MDW7983485.1 class I SAM-dependent methyltransferase [Acidobacteriota bacterium]